MKLPKEERLWRFLTKNLPSKKARKIYDYVSRYVIGRGKTISIKYEVDTSKLKKAIKDFERFSEILKRK